VTVVPVHVIYKVKGWTLRLYVPTTPCTICSDNVGGGPCSRQLRCEDLQYWINTYELGGNIGTLVSMTGDDADILQFAGESSLAGRVDCGSGVGVGVCW
jgi:hypothetical protein